LEILVTAADENAKAYQAIGEYFCAFSAVDYELGEAIKVAFGLQNNEASDATPQHHHLMRKRNVFGLKPAARLEWQDQNGNQAEQHQHCTLTLGYSLS
jgi:hypothetical protein